MRAAALALIAAVGCHGSEVTVPGWTEVRINELVAHNRAGIVDEAGQTADWVELYNPGTTSVSLDGWYLGPPEDRRAPLPAGTVVPAGGYAVLFADDQLLDGHLELRLSREGEALGLYAPDGAELDRVAWGPQLADHSLARVPDGGPDWQIRATPTPGEANGGEPYGSTASTEVCALSVDGEPHLLEGDTVRVSARCAGTGDWQIDWFGAAEVSDRAALSVDTGLADGGVWTFLASAKPRGAASVPATARIEISVADDWTDPDNVPVDPEIYVGEWGLPVLHVALDPTVATQEYQATTAWLDGVQYEATIKIRGAASAGYPKNNFTMEFDPIQLDLKPHGLQNKDHLVLVSNFDDNSHRRQRLVYDSWAAMAGFWGETRLTPRAAPIVVYMGGRYHGLYVALDHIDDEFLREMGFVDGGDLYKSVDHNANFYLTDTGGLPKGALWWGWEKKEGADVYDMASIEQLTAWSGAADSATLQAELGDWVDGDEMMDWFHLVFSLAAEDSAGKNAYLYVDPATGLYRYAPWDFNHAAGQTWQTARQPSDILNTYHWNNAFFFHFQVYPPLAEVLWDRYDQMHAPGGPLALDTLLGRLEAYDAELGGHPERDWERWEAEYRTYPLWSWRTDWTTPAEERAWLERWLVERDAVLADFP